MTLTEILRPYLPIDSSAVKRLVTQYLEHQPEKLPALYEAFKELGVEPPPGWTFNEVEDRRIEALINKGG